MKDRRITSGCAIPKRLSEIQTFLAYCIPDLLSALRNLSEEFPGSEGNVRGGEVDIIGALIAPKRRTLTPVEAMGEILRNGTRLMIHNLAQNDPTRQLAALEAMDAEFVACLVGILGMLVKATSSESRSVRQRSQKLVKAVGEEGLNDWLTSLTESRFKGLMESIDSEDEDLKNAIFGE